MPDETKPDPVEPKPDDPLKRRFRELKATGLDGPTAWAQARRELEGATVREPPLPAPKLELVPRAAFGARRCARPAEVAWTADHLLVADVRPEESPSAAAWGLLTWARTEPRRFWEELYPMLLPPRSK